MIEIPNIELAEWLADLKIYQKKQIAELIADNDLEIVAEKWISANGPNNTVSFGGQNNESTPFFINFKKEISKFLCGHEDYSEQRKMLNSEVTISKTVLLTLISGAVATKIGVLESLIVPAVAIILYLIGKMTIKAWCETNYEKK